MGYHVCMDLGTLPLVTQVGGCESCELGFPGFKLD